MIEIHPLRDKDKLSELFNNADIPINENSMAVVASDGDEVLGYCLFDMLEESLIVYGLEPSNDVMFADGILRSALHVGVQNGKTTAFYTESAPEKLFKTLGFIKNDETKELNVQLLFSSCGNCGK